MKTVIRFFAPYGRGWCQQSFSTYAEAERMVAFYRSCGTQADIVVW